ncbi:MAG: threonine synthase [Candidatus Delongbacteria bacterium]|nr:threonine synthase [Candidatus Delongbacteria bacterium]
MQKPITYYSTNLKAEPVSFKDALLKGIAPDKGLYMPFDIPQFTKDEINAFADKEYYEIAYEVIHKFLKDDIPADDLKELVKDAYNYEVPLEKGYDRKYVLRLDQGPTASFKDFAARMMGRLMNYYLQRQHRKLLILTATSGDTGSAIANAFYGLNNIKVVVLFPENEVTNRQRKQMTTLGDNVQIISLDGKFDDCQALVKEAFVDIELDHLGLSSANSINIGRLIPQTVYYFYAYAKLKQSNDEKVIFSVPSGNFGDMMGGVIAMKMGLPVEKFIIATNENDEFPKYLNTDKYELVVPSKNCISSAMNVGHPSNMSRLVALYSGIMNEKGEVLKAADMDLMRKEIWSVSIDDAHTKETIVDAWNKHQLLLEPHGSVGWAGLHKYLDETGDDKDQLYVSLETAHPAKFPEEITRLLNIDPDLPKSLEGIEEKEEQYDTITTKYEDFKAYLLKNYK